MPASSSFLIFSNICTNLTQIRLICSDAGLFSQVSRSVSMPAVKAFTCCETMWVC